MHLKIPNAATLRQRALQLFARAKAWSRLHPRKSSGHRPRHDCPDGGDCAELRSRRPSAHGLLHRQTF